MTQEEVIISLGLDQANLKTGLKGSDFLVRSSVEKTMQGVKQLVGLNLASLAVDAAKLLVDMWDKASKAIATEVYNLPGLELQGTLLAKMVAGLKDVVTLARASRTAFEAANEEFFLRNTSDTTRLKLFKEEKAAAEAAQDAVAAEINSERARHNTYRKSMTQEQEAKLLEEQARREIELNSLKMQGLKIQEKLDAVEARIADKKRQQLDAERSALQLAADRKRKSDEINDRIRNAPGDAHRPSLSDLATNPGPMQGDAQRAQDLQQQIKDAYIQGDPERAKDLETELYGGDRMPPAPGMERMRDWEDKMRNKGNDWKRKRGLPLDKDPYARPGLLGNLTDFGMAPDPVSAQIQGLRKDLAALARVKVDGDGAINTKLKMR